MASGSNFYLGSASDLASNMSSMFGNGSTQGMIGPPLQPRPIQAPPDRNAQQAQQPLVTGSGPASPGTYDPLASQAIRPTSFGNFDPQYGQNLSTFIGQSFQRPQANQPLQFNPYGNLTDANVNYPNVGGGNAPLPGLPQTLLSWAQMFSPSALTPPATQAATGSGSSGTTIIGYDENGGPIYG